MINLLLTFSETYIISLTGLLAIITLYLNYRQNRYSVIIDYYCQTQDIRIQTNKINSNSKKNIEYAKSIINQSINLYEVISYSIIFSFVNEKDAYNLLCNNIFGFYDKCLKGDIPLNNAKYFNQLYKRWHYYGLKKYYLKFGLKCVFFIILIITLYFVI